MKTVLLFLLLLGSGILPLGSHWAAIWVIDCVKGAGPPIPEYVTMLLLGCGLIGLASIGRRKLKRRTRSSKDGDNR